MYEALTEKNTRMGDHIGFNLGFNTPLSVFEWLIQPKNIYAQKLFDKAMTGIQVILGPRASLAGTSGIVELSIEYT